MWLRHTFELDRDIDAPLVLRMRVEGDTELFINGDLAIPGTSITNYLDDHQWNAWHWNRYVRMYPIVPCSKQVRLHKGKNVLAIHCRNPQRDRIFVDVGLYVANDNIDIEPMLDKVTYRVSDNAHLHTALALRFVEQQRWRNAAEQFHQSARIGDETDLPKWMWAALMYRQAQDYESYNDLANEIMDRFENEDSAERLGRLAKACLLAEPTPENRPGLVEMADRALKLHPDNPSAQVAKALAAYWSDDFEDAVRWSQKCSGDNRQALCVWALAHAQMGKLEAARNLLAHCVVDSPELHFQVSFRKKDAAHEAAFLKILSEEVQRRLIPE